MGERTEWGSEEAEGRRGRLPLSVLVPHLPTSPEHTQCGVHADPPLQALALSLSQADLFTASFTSKPLSFEECDGVDRSSLRTPTQAQEATRAFRKPELVQLCLVLKGLLTCRWDEPSIQHHPSPSPKHVTVQPVFGHLASPTNLISPGTSQRQSRRHLTLGLRKPRAVREKRGGGSRAAGRGRQRTPRGRAGSWQGGHAGGISRPGRPSPRGQQTGRRFCTSRGAEDFPRLCPRTKPTAGVVANFTAYSPPNHDSPQGCRRVRLVPGSKTGGGRIGMGGRGFRPKTNAGVCRGSDEDLGLRKGSWRSKGDTAPISG